MLLFIEILQSISIQNTQDTFLSFWFQTQPNGRWNKFIFGLWILFHPFDSIGNEVKNPWFRTLDSLKWAICTEL